MQMCYYVIIQICGIIRVMSYILKLHNTLTNSIETFAPIDPNHVTMYVCGPTVYDRPHIGNARPAIVFDVLYRLLQHLYGNVTYVRNITDIDDKIYKKSIELDVPVKDVTDKATAVYHDNLAELGILPVDIEPKATENIAGMIEMISALLDAGKAYISDNHVYFDSSSYEHYGILSNKNKDEQIAGARVATTDSKEDQSDFVLWKPISDDFNMGWDSPWGVGRPGWHIECSVMSKRFLGDQIDIHGGGCDLIFPHHENENAQSCAISGKKSFANYWVHNGHLNISGDKMSKSIGNTVYLGDLLDRYTGPDVKFAMLSTHYASPINWTDDLLSSSHRVLTKWWRCLSKYDLVCDEKYVNEEVVDQLCNNLNTAGAFTVMHRLFGEISDSASASRFYNTCLNIFGLEIDKVVKVDSCDIDEAWINKMLEKRAELKAAKRYEEADAVRAELEKSGITIMDGVDGTEWSRS